MSVDFFQFAVDVGFIGNGKKSTDWVARGIGIIVKEDDGPKNITGNGYFNHIFCPYGNGN